MPDPAVIISSTVMGAAVGAAGYFGRDKYNEALDFIERDLTEKLKRLRVSTLHLRQYLVVWSAIIGLTAASLWILLDSFVFALLAAVLMACLPWYAVRRMAQRRKQKLEDQLADGMASFASAIKAGLSIAQAIELLADQGPRPLKDEFRQIVGEYKLGKPLERTLEEAKERLKSENFALFAAALLASRESGGRLNETVDRIAKAVLEMQRLERKVRSETAQARRSALYMALAPAFILLVYYFIDPVNTRRLFVSVPGQIIVTIAVVLDVLAYLWARKILNPDI
jgi:tight adherence protein B